MLKADLHIHTGYSMDCDTTLDSIISRCLETGIDCIAVSDHDSIEGALQMQETAPFPVIVAEEILTPQGEIMGMFLQERIPSGVAIDQAIERIKTQGGLVCLPHPFDTLRGLRVNGQKFKELAAQIDIVEVFNARSPFPRCSNKARTYAEKYNIPGTAGSDAHAVEEIGSTFIEMPEFNGRDEFLASLKEGRVHRKRSSYLVHFHSTWAKFKKSF